jgi:Phosphotransferase enzyme family
VSESMITSGARSISRSAADGGSGNDALLSPPLGAPAPLGQSEEELEQAARRAWRTLQGPSATVERIEPVKIRRNLHANVYRLVGAQPAGCAVIAKRGLLSRAHAERTIYENLLPQAPVRTLRYYGCVEESDHPYCWLFLEDAAGEEYSAALAAHRRLAGHWLGAMHGALEIPAAVNVLPDRGPDHYLQCLRGASDCLREQLTGASGSPEHIALLAELAKQCDTVERGWERVEELCSGVPRTLVHADFSYKNVRVRPGPGEALLLVYDWESAGRGVPAVDLAQSPVAAPHFAGQADLSTYWQVLRDYWPRTDRTTVEQWAEIGTLFRWLAALHWDTRSLRRGWAPKLLKRAPFYQSVLSHILRSAAWVRG